MQIEFYQNLTKLTDKNHHSLEQKILHNNYISNLYGKLIFADLVTYQGRVAVFKPLLEMF